LTEVWVPVGTGSLQALSIEPLSRDPDPDTRREILDRINLWPEEDLKAIALRKYEKGVPLDQCARERGINPRSQQFTVLVITMYHRLADLLENNEDKS
jgi:hypothetical protein